MSQPASWAVLNENDSLAMARRARVRAEHEFWRTIRPLAEVDSEEDWTAVCARLHRSTGMTPGYLTRHLSALDTLDRLPGLKAVAHETDLLDMNHLKIINQTVAGAPTALAADPFFWETLDSDLLDRFTPSRPQQLLPSGRAIIETVKRTIRSVEELAAAGPDPWGRTEDPDAPSPQPCEDPAALLTSLPPVEEEPSPRLHVEHEVDGEMHFLLTVDQATGTLLLDTLTQAAEANGTSRGRAMVDLILEPAALTVTSLIYSAHDVEDSPVYHPLSGLLTRDAADTLLGMVGRTLDMDEAGRRHSTAYTPPFSIRAHLIGRDWVCRWPGCSRSALHADNDHRINHADGGPTTASNMVMLCRHHHNRKTDLQATYLLDPVTGDVYWHFPDGTYTVDLASGPLAPREKRWVQTYAQRRQKSQERAAAKAAAERLEEYQRQHDPP